MDENFADNSTEQFYDSLFEDYHLIFPNWDHSIKRQSKVLDQLIKQYAQGASNKIWDCTCGIGTQALGLGMMGYEVMGTDLSSQSIARAKHEAQIRGLATEFAVADLRSEKQIPSDEYDVVISCDNSLPHLIDEKELALAAKHIKTHLRAGGLFIGSIRDYDQILADKPRSTPPSLKREGEEQMITFQIWEWNTEQTYQLKHFVLKGKNDVYASKVRSATYRAYRRVEMEAIFLQAGFKTIEWIFPQASAYYQPIFIGR